MLWNYGQRPYFHKRDAILQILIRTWHRPPERAGYGALVWYEQKSVDRRGMTVGIIRIHWVARVSVR